MAAAIHFKHFKHQNNLHFYENETYYKWEQLRKKNVHIWESFRFNTEVNLWLQAAKKTKNGGEIDVRGGVSATCGGCSSAKGGGRHSQSRRFAWLDHPFQSFYLFRLGLHPNFSRRRHSPFQFHHRTARRDGSDEGRIRFLQQQQPRLRREKRPGEYYTLGARHPPLHLLIFRPLQLRPEAHRHRTISVFFAADCRPFTLPQIQHSRFADAVATHRPAAEGLSSAGNRQSSTVEHRSFYSVANDRPAAAQLRQLPQRFRPLLLCRFSDYRCSDLRSPWLL